MDDLPRIFADHLIDVKYLMNHVCLRQVTIDSGRDEETIYNVLFDSFNILIQSPIPSYKGICLAYFIIYLLPNRATKGNFHRAIPK